MRRVEDVDAKRESELNCVGKRTGGGYPTTQTVSIKERRQTVLGEESKKRSGQAQATPVFFRMAEWEREETENPGWTATGRWDGHVWLLHVFALPCLAAGGRRRLRALADILSLKWTWESRKTPAQELVPKETWKRSWKLERRHLAQSPLLPSERGPILCDLAVGWLVKRPQSGSLPAGRSWPRGKRDATPVWRLFLAGTWPRPIDRPSES